MIIWINGAFGAGKSQTAYELHRRLAGSFVFDPENAGFYIRKQLPMTMLKADFQDYPVWREINYAMLKYISKEYKGHIIVPMTVVSPAYFLQIIGQLKLDGLDVRHFTLWASKPVLLKRLRSRGDGARSWGAAQIDRCMQSLSGELFQKHLNTDEMTTEQVVQAIAAELDLTLLPDNRSKLQKSFDRIATQIKQIRLFS
ncbi:AAA family ATPase [Paenibacillus sp. NEAU-GSW1]|uniref:AAA family ATPase n=1 Tax=Paenibacillus sp. NEAU-GSW1 TaxID=2682486 RepID=UPI00139C001A|nr:AAA family ATPase [Paenibacillus sp. NEAU-GSW1]